MAEKAKPTGSRVLKYQVDRTIAAINPAMKRDSDLLRAYDYRANPFFEWPLLHFS